MKQRQFDAPPGKWLSTVGALLVVALATMRVAADPARFWISTSTVSATGAESPSIGGIEGSTRYVHIWAQPATVGAGSFHAATNPFKQIENFSLNLVADAPVVDFLNDSIIVHNVLDATTKRFEHLGDSSTGLTSTRSQSQILATGVSDRVQRISGFNISESPSGGVSFVGYGGAGCLPNDPYCAMTTSGAPAWLVASVAARVIASTSPTNYHLQFSLAGTNHVNETSQQTSAIFGSGSLPVYNAFSNVDVTLPGDSPDFSLEPLPPSAVVPTLWPGGNSPWHLLAGGTPPSWMHDVQINGGTVLLTGAQQANHTTIGGGHLQIAAGGSLASDVTVSSGGKISGEGLIAANLTLNGTLEIGAAKPLHVLGAANINGCQIVLPPGYSQAPNTTAELTIVKSDRAIQGTLNANVGQALGIGLTLQAINYSARQVSIQIQATGLPGDYNNNGQVDAADYIVWRKTLGQSGSGLAADGDGNGSIGTGDFTYWRARFGNTSASGAGLPNYASTAVPEPASLLGILSIVACLATARRQRT